MRVQVRPASSDCQTSPVLVPKTASSPWPSSAVTVDGRVEPVGHPLERGVGVERRPVDGRPSAAWAVGRGDEDRCVGDRDRAAVGEVQPLGVHPPGRAAVGGEAEPDGRGRDDEVLPAPHRTDLVDVGADVDGRDPAPAAVVRAGDATDVDVREQDVVGRARDRADLGWSTPGRVPLVATVHGLEALDPLEARGTEPEKMRAVGADEDPSGCVDRAAETGCGSDQGPAAVAGPQQVAVTGDEDVAEDTHRPRNGGARRVDQPVRGRDPHLHRPFPWFSPASLTAVSSAAVRKALRTSAQIPGAAP